MKNLTCSFKKNIVLIKRKIESKRILGKYQDKIPIIVSKDEKSQIASIDKCKYLATHEDITKAQFAVIIRKRIDIIESWNILLLQVITLCLHQAAVLKNSTTLTKMKMDFYTSIVEKVFLDNYYL